jgi:retinol dehydrogenase-12
MNIPEAVINVVDINMEKGGSQTTKYGQSKAGNIFLGYEFAEGTKLDGLICVVRSSLQLLPQLCFGFSSR